jgi:hypothetical protein
MSPEQFEDRLRMAQELEIKNLKPIENELQNICELIERTEQDADQIADAIRKTRGIVVSRLQNQAEEINNRYEALINRKNELERNITKSYLTEDKILNLLEFREIVASGLENPNFEDKRRWLEILSVGIRIKNQIAVISCRLPIEPLEINLRDVISTGGGSDPASDSGQVGAYEFSTSRSLKTKLRRKFSTQGRRCRTQNGWLIKLLAIQFFTYFHSSYINQKADCYEFQRQSAF